MTFPTSIRLWTDEDYAKRNSYSIGTLYLASTFQAKAPSKEENPATKSLEEKTPSVKNSSPKPFIQPTRTKT